MTTTPTTKIKTRRYYAGRHVLDTTFSYDAGWTVFVFDSATERDLWVMTENADEARRGCSPRCEAITRRIARRIAGAHVAEEWLTINCRYLAPSHAYYRSEENYWSAK